MTVASAISQPLNPTDVSNPIWETWEKFWIGDIHAGAARIAVDAEDDRHRTLSVQVVWKTDGVVESQLTQVSYALQTENRIAPVRWTRHIFASNGTPEAKAWRHEKGISTESSHGKREFQVSPLKALWSVIGVRLWLMTMPLEKGAEWKAQVFEDCTPEEWDEHVFRVGSPKNEELPGQGAHLCTPVTEHQGKDLVRTWWFADSGELKAVVWEGGVALVAGDNPEACLSGLPEDVVDVFLGKEDETT